MVSGPVPKVVTGSGDPFKHRPPTDPTIAGQRHNSNCERFPTLLHEACEMA